MILRVERRTKGFILNRIDGGLRFHAQPTLLLKFIHR
jgi:hypothetical protein